MVVAPFLFRSHAAHVIGLMFGISASGRVSPHAHAASFPTRRAAIVLRRYAAAGSRGIISSRGSVRLGINPLKSKMSSVTQQMENVRIENQADALVACISHS